MALTTCEAQATVRSIAETHRLAAAVADLLEPGDVVCLVGQLGAGKTWFTKGLVAGLGGDADAVTSPTFVLMQRYDTDRPGDAGEPMPVFHFDAYRLHSGQDLVDIGSDDALASDGVTVIEWADRVADALPRERLDIHLASLGETMRRVQFVGHGPRGCAIVAALVRSGAVAAG